MVRDRNPSYNAKECTRVERLSCTYLRWCDIGGWLRSD